MTDTSRSLNIVIECEDLSFEEKDLLRVKLIQLKDSAPSNSSMEFVIKKNNNNYVSTYKLYSADFNFKNSIEFADITEGIKAIDSEFKSKIKEWKESRF